MPDLQTWCLDSACDLMQFFGSDMKCVLFKNCKLNSADFRSAKIEDVRLTNCQLIETEFSDAVLKDVDFRGSCLDGMKANAKDLKGAIVDYQQALDQVEFFAKILGIRVTKD